jgi:hypothetical protein
VHLGAHGGDIGFVTRVVQYICNQVGRCAGFFILKSACCHGGCADTDTAGHHGLFGVVGDGVLVDRHVGSAQHGLGFLAGDALGTQVDQHHMAIGAAADNAKAAGCQCFRHDFGVAGNLLLVSLEFGLQRFLEGHGFCRDHMHQRAALQAGEDGAVDGFFVFGLHQDDAATGAAQALVGGRGHHVGMGYWVGVHAGGNQASVMGHIDHKDGANILSDLGKAFKIDSKRISTGAGDDKFWLGLMRLAFHGVVVDSFVGIQAIAHHIEPLTAHVEVHAVRQVTTFGQTHAHDGVAGLQERQKDGFVGRGAAMGLYVGGFRTKNLFDAVNSQLLGHVHMLASAVIAPTGIAFGVFVGQLAALGRHNSRGGVVFAGDQLNMVFLARVLGQDGSPQFGVGLFNKDVTVVHGSPKRQMACGSKRHRAAQANG